MEAVLRCPFGYKDLTLSYGEAESPSSIDNPLIPGPWAFTNEDKFWPGCGDERDWPGLRKGTLPSPCCEKE